MIHKISSKITSMFLSDNREYPQEVYRYGMEIILSSLTGCLSVILISALLGDVLEGIIYIAALSLIRLFAGGYHADTYLKCNIITISTFCISLLIHKFYIYNYIAYNPIILAVSATFVLVMLILYAPVENENKPIPDSDRPRLKTISIAIATLIFGIVLIVYYLFDFRQILIAISALIIETNSIIISLVEKAR